MTHHPSIKGPYKATIPSGVPVRIRRPTKEASGLLLRGVVIRVYSYDEVRMRNRTIIPSSLYCDVLIYSSRAGNRVAVIRDCVVSQESGGVHNGTIYRPKATTLRFDGPLDLNKVRNPAELDGDHVLVGFLDNDVATPIILRWLAHPSTDARSSLPTTVNVAGHRCRLISTDGDVRLWRHHGTFFGVQDDGSFVVDNSRGHQGRVEADGSEQPYDAPDPATGTVPAPPNTLFRLRPGGKFRVEIVDPDDPDGVTKTFELEANQTELRIRLNGEDNLVLTQSGENAEMQIGDGAVHVPIGEHLKTLYDNLKARLDAFDIAFAQHLHGTSFGPTTAPQPGASISAPDWSSVPTIISTKVSLPDE
jgi:hypothetical protein